MYFSASYYPLALSLRKSFQYIPCSVVSTLFLKIFKLEGLPLFQIRPWPALRASRLPLAGDLSLYIHRKPQPGAASGSSPQSKCLLSETQKHETKQNPPTEGRRKERRRKQKCRTALRSWSAPEDRGNQNSQRRVFRKS